MCNILYIYIYRERERETYYALLPGAGTPLPPVRLLRVWVSGGLTQEDS